MKKTEYIVITLSVSLTALISALLGLAGSAIIGPFWSWFWISFLLITISFAIINSYFITKDQQFVEAVELETLKELTKISTKISCAYCQQLNSTSIVFNQKNTFKCESCNQVNGISIQLLATALTTPIESVRLPIEGETNTIAEFKVSR